MEVEKKKVVPTNTFTKKRGSEKRKNYVFLAHAIEKYNSSSPTPSIRGGSEQKTKKSRAKFTINTLYCRSEYDTLMHVINSHSGLKETRAIGEGSLIWYSGAMREID